MRSMEDVAKIEALIESLCNNNPSVDKNIPKYLYHFSDIENIIGILESGYLYSRNYAIEKELMKNDNANQNVIKITDDQHKNYVRLYFRPRTPTQYHNEGIKSEYRDYEVEGHSPIPIFLLFSSKKMLSREDTKFVGKNLALKPVIKNTIDDLLKFDFEKIFHNGPIGGDRDIIEKRHAEVLINEKCDLANLELIVVRSSAEKETLINLLIDKNINLDLDIKILTDGRNIVYNKSRAYIDYVELNENYFKIGFTNFSTLTENDIIKLQLRDKENIVSKKVKAIECISGKKFKLENERDSYELCIYVNHKLVYLGRYLKETNLPF